jgi:hypothetical protein
MPHNCNATKDATNSDDYLSFSGEKTIPQTICENWHSTCIPVTTVVSFFDDHLLILTVAEFVGPGLPSLEKAEKMGEITSSSSI